MSAAGAWLLEFGDGVRAAIGERELFHILYRPTLHALPRAPAHCSRLIEWEGRMLPLWDLHRRLNREAAPAAAELVAIVGYRGSDGSTVFAAFGITVPPQRIGVDDADACDLPVDRPAWRALTKSCFSHSDAAVPVLDLASMFTPRPC